MLAKNSSAVVLGSYFPNNNGNSAHFSPDNISKTPKSGQLSPMDHSVQAEATSFSAAAACERVKISERLMFGADPSINSNPSSQNINHLRGRAVLAPAASTGRGSTTQLPSTSHLFCSTTTSWAAEKVQKQVTEELAKRSLIPVKPRFLSLALFVGCFFLTSVLEYLFYHQLHVPEEQEHQHQRSDQLTAATGGTTSSVDGLRQGGAGAASEDAHEDLPHEDR